VVGGWQEWKTARPYAPAIAALRIHARVVSHGQWREGTVIFVGVLGAIIFGAWTAISLFTGKFFNPKAVWFSDMFVERRKEPFSYWLMVASTGGLMLLCVVGTVKMAISN
jgi:hypothetical protein